MKDGLNLMQFRLKVTLEVLGNQFKILGNNIVWSCVGVRTSKHNVYLFGFHITLHY
jgi:hypothetical protein